MKTIADLVALCETATGWPCYPPGHLVPSLPAVQLNALNLDPSTGGRAVLWEGEVVVSVHQLPADIQYEQMLLPAVRDVMAALVADNGWQFSDLNTFDAGDLPQPWIGHRIQVAAPMLDLCPPADPPGGGGQQGAPPAAPAWCAVEFEDAADPPFQIECEAPAGAELYRWEGERDSIATTQLKATLHPFTTTAGLTPGTWRFRARGSNPHGDSDWSPWSNYTEVP